MAKKSLRLSVGSIFTKGPGKIYFYRYQLDGHRKTVSLQTTNRAEAVKNWLVEQGIEASRIQAVGKGSDHHAADANAARRVETKEQEKEECIQ